MQALEHPAGFSGQLPPVRRVVVRAVAYSNGAGEEITNSIVECRQSFVPSSMELRAGERRTLLDCVWSFSIVQAHRPDLRVVRRIVAEIALGGSDTTQITTSFFGKQLLSGERLLYYHTDWAVCHGRRERLAFRHFYDSYDGILRVLQVEFELECRSR